MNRILYFFINTNIFVSISTFCLYKISELLFGFQNYKIGLFIFFSTLFAYNYMRLPLFCQENFSNNYSTDYYQKSIYFFLFISALFIIFLSFSLGLKFIQLLFPPILISIIYPLLIKINNRQYGIRNIPFLKIFLISFTWSYVTLLLPGLYYDIQLDYFLLSSFFERFLFVLAIAIPFDIRDYNSDKIQTIPNTIGVINSKIFAWFCLLLIQILLVINVIQSNITMPIFLGLFLSIEICSLVIYLTNSERSSFFYSILVESLSLVMYLIVLTSYMF
ncbi:MAG: hypothetical protein CMP54_03065 [Flavobacteriales bacterium]|nr:hypothetical protein [Flavobacteriales bacterium]